MQARLERPCLGGITTPYRPCVCAQLIATDLTHVLHVHACAGAPHRHHLLLLAQQPHWRGGHPRAADGAGGCSAGMGEGRGLRGQQSARSSCKCVLAIPAPLVARPDVVLHVTHFATACNSLETVC